MVIPEVRCVARVFLSAMLTDADGIDRPLQNSKSM